ncbi:hypothetical protein SKAU_G00404120 [Synaphobranchus kaupii]|uniref:Uncharacterized protein n=1 Tax=Synaphobranchus kaupii TaxID=118154 RepID=A0A9Q1E9M1_SYNKA|nr:hypothetical protein SKAU_G00404120 [Synaphobranchus kaupii]
MFGLQQDRPVKPVFGDKEAGSGPSSVCLISNGQLRGNRKCEKDGNFNFLGQEDDILTGDENRNQLRSRVQSAQGRDAHFGSGALSPLSRLPCWSPLEPLPEIDIGEEGCGRVPPEGAEGKMDEEETGRGREEKNEKKVLFEAKEEEEEEEGEEQEEAVWSLREREKFKAREMEKHQVQLTMYRRLALIRWVRTLQGRVQDQQNRLQSSFDIILTHRKELLRLGAATASQS